MYCDCTILSRIAALTTDQGLITVLLAFTLFGPVSPGQVLLYSIAIRYGKIICCTLQYCTVLIVLYCISFQVIRLAGLALSNLLSALTLTRILGPNGPIWYFTALLQPPNYYTCIIHSSPDCTVLDYSPQVVMYYIYGSDCTTDRAP